MVEFSENNVNKINRIIEEIGLTPKNIMQFEECEIITDLMDDDIVNEVPDQQFRILLKKMRALHEEIRKMNYGEYIQTAVDIYQRIPNKEDVLKYHDAEQISKLLTDTDLTCIQDNQLRNTIRALKHVHDNIAEKKANVIRRMNLY
ncbi:MAG: hypothetical protein JSV76_02680 [Candidatus Bathyarchaeota archaeon]|nr:MAG: hypothetical protein JSV76_02680 [Candidatus Bathyarchaeota archaeon]